MARVATVLTLAAVVGWSAPGLAREALRREAPAADAPASAPSRFYPQEIDGGVSGNLPFNNQIRKFKDPLNANGAK